MVYRLELTYSELTEILDTKYIAASPSGCAFPPSSYEIKDLILMLYSLPPVDVKVNVTISNFRQRPN